MRAVRLLLAVFLVAELFGCANQGGVLTPQEFTGFCYQAGGRRISCDNISICNEYLSVFEQSFAKRADCSAACQSIYTRQSSKPSVDVCWLTIPDMGNAYCQRYCREAYPQ